MLFQDFMQKYKVGHSYGYNGGYNGECVSLVKNFIKDVLGVKPQSIGNAKEYWLKRDCEYIKSIFKPLEAGKTPKRGDLFIRVSGVYGHIGIVVSATAKEFKTFEQNFGGCRKVEERTHSYSDDVHFLRPKDRKNVVYVPEIKTGVYKLADVRGLYKGWGTSTGYVMYNDLTKDGKAHATKKTGRAILKSGTKVTIEKTKRLSSGNIWAKIPSGYMCIWHWEDNKMYIK